MPHRCVAGGCSNVPDSEKNVGLHQFPEEADKKRRRQWVTFVRTKRAKWSPTKNSRLCSQHFREDDFDNHFVQITGTPFGNKRVLKKDAIPTIHKESEEKPSEQPRQQQPLTSVKRSSREHRRVVRDLLKDQPIRPPILPSPGTTGESVREELGLESQEDPIEVAIVGDSMDLEPVAQAQKNLQLTRDDCTQTPECLGCKNLLSRNRQLRNKLIDVENKWKKRFQQCEEEVSVLKTPPMTKDEDNGNVEESDEEDEDIIEEEPPLSEMSSPEYKMFSDTETETETETEDESDDEKPKKKSIANSESGNLRNQPKFIVFLSKLLLLFNICPSCKFEKPSIETSVCGTMVEITTQCFNPQCPTPKNTWRSQPNMTGTKMPAMNFLLCFSILVSGASPSKVFQVFKNMGVQCVSLQTYFKHQAQKLFPTLHIFWKKYQEEMMTKIKETGQSLVLAGDGRHDSMGHSAKYCAYTIFCCTIPLIIEFSLVQRNVAGSSPAMEMLAFRNCMGALSAWSLAIGTLITDRHTSIAKYMREQLKHITHYFDLWHLKKKIHKVLTKISKEKGCEILNEWIKPCQNHLMWSATSTPSGNGQLIWAKFKSYLSHIVNNHKDLDEPMFNKCSHEDSITQRRWLEEDTPVYDKVCTALTKASLMKGIKKASPVCQTSCLEGFHSVVNQYCPKMTGYSYQGMYCRHIVAATHFNYNLQRKVKTAEDGSEKVTIVYPKFKNGEATVRSVKVAPNYDYIDRIYDTFIEAQNQKNLLGALEELNAMTPAPMHTMLEKQSRQDAVALWMRRKSMVVQEVPGTAVNEAERVDVSTRAGRAVEGTTSRAQPRCRICKNPMKNHKDVKDCPKNKKA